MIGQFSLDSKKATVKANYHGYSHSKSAFSHLPPSLVAPPPQHPALPGLAGRCAGLVASTACVASRAQAACRAARHRHLAAALLVPRGRGGCQAPAPHRPGTGLASCPPCPATTGHPFISTIRAAGRHDARPGPAICHAHWGLLDNGPATQQARVTGMRGMGAP